jgi:hypothetical protein
MGPRVNGLRPSESQVTKRRSSVRYAVKDSDLLVADGSEEAADTARGRMDEQRFAVAAVEVRGRVVVGLEVRPAQRRGQQEQAQQAAPHFGIVRFRLVLTLSCAFALLLLALVTASQRHRWGTTPAPNDVAPAGPDRGRRRRRRRSMPNHAARSALTAAGIRVASPFMGGGTRKRRLFGPPLNFPCPLRVTLVRVNLGLLLCLFLSWVRM